MAPDPRWTKEELEAGRAWRRARRLEFERSPEGRRRTLWKLWCNVGLPGLLCLFFFGLLVLTSGGKP